MPLTVTDKVVVSIHLDGPDGTAGRFLERGLLVAPRIVAAPAERLLAAVDTGAALEVVLAPPVGLDGPIEHVHPSHIDVLRVKGEPDATAIVVIHLPTATAHTHSPSHLHRKDADHTVLAPMKSGGRRAFFEGLRDLGATTDAGDTPSADWFARVDTPDRARPVRPGPAAPSVSVRELAQTSEIRNAFCCLTGKCQCDDGNG